MIKSSAGAHFLILKAQKNRAKAEIFTRAVQATSIAWFSAFLASRAQTYSKNGVKGRADLNCATILIQAKTSLNADVADAKISEARLNRG